FGCECEDLLLTYPEQEESHSETEVLMPYERNCRESEIKLGTVVRVRSDDDQTPYMVVNAIVDKMALCVWWDDDDRGFRSVSLHVGGLYKVDEETEFEEA